MRTNIEIDQKVTDEILEKQVSKQNVRQSIWH